MAAAGKNKDQGAWLTSGRALFFPAAAIALVVIGVNLTADGIKRVLQAPDNH